MLHPIAIGRIDDLNLLAIGQCRELAITWIKSRINQCLRQINILAVIPFGEIYSLYEARRAINYGLIKAIANTRLTVGM